MKTCKWSWTEVEKSMGYNLHIPCLNKQTWWSSKLSDYNYCPYCGGKVQVLEEEKKEEVKSCDNCWKKGATACNERACRKWEKFKWEEDYKLWENAEGKIQSTISKEGR